MSKAEKIFDQTFTARNFSTSPVTISDLSGNIYDYQIIVKLDTAGADVNLWLRCNGESTGQYRNYYMYGLSSTVSGSTDDSAAQVQINNGIGTAQQGLFLFKVTGSSGDERYIDAFFTCDGRVGKQSSYWKNTADELDEISILGSASQTTDAHIIIYRTLKEASQSSWELMKTGSISQDINSSPYDITGLDGDVDIKYRLVFSNLSVSSIPQLLIRLNGDTGSTHTNQALYNVNGTLYSQNISNWEIYNGESGTLSNLSIDINAESGIKRLSTYSTSDLAGDYDQYEGVCWWANTADNLTSVQLASTSSNTLTCDFKLYRLKKPNGPTGDTLPFETIETVSVSGDFSSGHTFNVSGSDNLALYKIEWLGANTSSASVLRMQINADTGSNYIEQRLRGNSATASSASTTQTYFDYCWTQNGDMSYSTMYLFPKSGENRPYLSTFALDEDQLDLRAGWWANSVDAITSIKVYASNTNSHTGTLKLSRLR